MQGGDWFW